MVAVNSAHIGFDFDFDDRTVFGGAEFAQRLVAGRADAALLCAVFVHHWQLRVHGAPVVGCAVLMAFLRLV